MTAIKSWLLSVVACGFLTALAQTLPLNRTGKRSLTLVCGCLTVLAVLRPLLGLRGIALRDLLPPPETADPAAVASAQAENEAILRELIRSQTEELLTGRASQLGADLSFRVELRRDDAAGLDVPWSVEIRGTADEDSRSALAAFLRDEIGIPPERQRWVGP